MVSKEAASLKKRAFRSLHVSLSHPAPQERHLSSSLDRPHSCKRKRPLRLGLWRLQSCKVVLLKSGLFRNLKDYQYSAEGQKLHQHLAPVLVITLWNSLVFSRKMTTSTDFCRCCAPDASALVVVKISLPLLEKVQCL